MLTAVTDGVLVHRSELIQNSTVVVQGPSGVLLVDPGVTASEMACLAQDLREQGLAVVAGFSTHPDWDHVLWHDGLGEAPRYATARGAELMRQLRSQEGWRARAAGALPEEIAGDVPLEPFGLLTALPEPATHVPWDGPTLRLVEHPAHSEGHAALVVEEHRVLVAGDMLSDILPPFLDLDAADPVGYYLAGLSALEAVTGEVDAVVPGHGSVGRGDEVSRRIDLDRAYVLALAEGRLPDDPRTSPSAAYGADWLPGLSEWQLQTLTERAGAGSPG